MDLPRLAKVSVLTIVAICVSAPASAQSSSSTPSSHPVAKSATRVGQPEATLDAGTVADGVYRNKTLGFSCKIPVGWVLRTEEMNGREEQGATPAENPHLSQKQGEVGHPTSTEDSHPVAKTATRVGQPSEGRVLLAAFSRPPEAHGEEVNASILIAAESVEAYPGLTDAEQYFGPLTEVAKAQGFMVDEEPYEFAIGTRKVVRGDFHKDVGSRVMRQSTLALLSHGYTVSITVIGGTEDGVEELIDGLTFWGGK